MPTNPLARAFRFAPVLPVLVAALAMGSSPGASAFALSTVQDQSDLDLSTAFVISGFLAADDLNFPVNSRIDTVTVWLTDTVVNNNGILDGFSGSLSWAIYTDTDPGPGYLAYSGTDTTPELIDTGLQSTAGYDVFRVRIDLDGRPIVGPGRVYLAIHEGAWGSPGDGSSIYWLCSASAAGSNAWVTGVEVNPQPADWLVSNYDAALVVESDPHLWYGGYLDASNGGNITSAVSASDFYLGAAATIGSIDTWIGDAGPNNGVFDGFNGTLSWALYSDSAGDPGTLIASGSDTTPKVLDSGLDMIGDRDVARVRIELRPRPTLAAGTWWLVLHEGAWGSPGDAGSNIFWSRSSSLLYSTSRYSFDETNPGSWSELFSDADLAFVLFNDSIFASGFDSGGTCAWSAVVGGATCP